MDWISTKDKLPKNRQVVTFLTRLNSYENEWSCYTGMFFKEGTDVSDGDDGISKNGLFYMYVCSKDQIIDYSNYVYDMKDVEYWLPLPMLPKLQDVK